MEFSFFPLSLFCNGGLVYLLFSFICPKIANIYASTKIYGLGSFCCCGYCSDWIIHRAICSLGCNFGMRFCNKCSSFFLKKETKITKEITQNVNNKKLPCPMAMVTYFIWPHNEIRAADTGKIHMYMCKYITFVWGYFFHLWWWTTTKWKREEKKLTMDSSKHARITGFSSILYIDIFFCEIYYKKEMTKDKKMNRTEQNRI